MLGLTSQQLWFDEQRGEGEKSGCQGIDSGISSRSGGLPVSHPEVLPPLVAIALEIKSGHFR